MAILPALIWAILPALPQASTRHDGSLCEWAADLASRETGVPARVLLALSLTETGRAPARGLPAEPWPWAINAGGKSHWFETRDAAFSHAAALLAEGQRNFDLGCFQINHRWHSQGFASLDAMIAPDSNALYAARMLARLYRQHGDWVLAAGAYHSATEAHAAPYRDRFAVVLAALDQTPIPPDAPPPTAAEGVRPLWDRSGSTALITVEATPLPLIGY
jgi:hypothetical protein